MITLLVQPVKVVIDIDVVVAGRTVGILLMGDILVYFVAGKFEIDMHRLGGRGHDRLEGVHAPMNLTGSG